MLPVAPATLLALVLLPGPAAAQTSPEAARDTVRRLTAAVEPLRRDYAPPSRKPAADLLTRLASQLAALPAPQPATPAKAEAFGRLPRTVMDALAEENAFASRPAAAAVLPAATAQALVRRAKTIADDFKVAFPPPPAPAAANAVRAPPRPPVARADLAAKAVERHAQGAKAAASAPNPFFDGSSQRGAPALPGAPAAGPRPDPALPQVPPAKLHLEAPPAPPLSPESAACRQTIARRPRIAQLCDAHPTMAPLLAGLMDAVTEQFGTVEGLAMNVTWILLGLAMSALSGVGLFWKVLMGILNVGLTLWVFWPLLEDAWAAIKDLRRTKSADPKHMRALVSIGITVGTVALSAGLMALGGGIGRTMGGSRAEAAGMTARFADPGGHDTVANLLSTIPGPLRTAVAGALGHQEPQR